MASFLHIGHVRERFARPEKAARHRERAGGQARREAPPAVPAGDAAAAWDELAVFGLCDAGDVGPSSVQALNRLGDRRGLEAMGLLDTGTRRPKEAATLADASPYDLLLYLGLMG